MVRGPPSPRRARADAARHTLSSAQKTEYLDAELCLMWQIPSVTGLPAARSAFDDLLAAHQVQAAVVHRNVRAPPPRRGRARRR